MLQPVKRSTLGDKIIDQIKGLIVEGKLKAGDKLPPERQLIDMLKVGRTSLREALKALESQGLVRRSQSGTYISADFRAFFSDALTYRLYLADAQMDEVFETRRTMEKELAYLAALRASEEDVRQLEEAVLRMQGAVAEGNLEAFAQADIFFHERIARAAGNSVLYDIYLSIRDLVFHVQEKMLAIQGVMEDALLSHQAILRAVREKDAEKARESMLKHLEAVHQYAKRNALSHEKREIGEKRGDAE